MTKYLVGPVHRTLLHTHTQLGEVVGHCDNGSVVRGREGGRERDRQTGRLTDKGKNRDRQTEGQRDRDRD